MIIATTNIDEAAGTHRYNFYVRDYLGSVRAVVGANGELWQFNDYHVTGIPSSQFGQLNADDHLHTGKEYNAFNGLFWYDNSARMLDPIFNRFTTPDPLAEKYPGISPYAHCNNNPLKYIDPTGRKPRLYIDTGGTFGHVAVSSGSGSNMTIYTYGRYGATYGTSSTPKNLHTSGEGVLIKLKGKEATQYIQNKMSGADIYEFNGSDDIVDKHFDNLLKNSKTSPSKGVYKNAINAKVIDTYNVFNNNCVTKSMAAIRKSLSSDPFSAKWNNPLDLNIDMQWQVLVKNITQLLNAKEDVNINIRKINNEDEEANNNGDY